MGTTTSHGAGQQRLKKATDAINSAETITNSIVAVAKKTIENKAATESMISIQVKKLQDQQKKISDLQQSLTNDIVEARTGGASSTTTVTELSKLSPKIRTLQN